MTAPINPLSQELAQNKPVSSESSAASPKRSYTLEKAMLMLTLVFFGGIVAMTVLEPPYEGMAMTAIVALTFWILIAGR